MSTAVAVHCPDARRRHPAAGLMLCRCDPTPLLAAVLLGLPFCGVRMQQPWNIERRSLVPAAAHPPDGDIAHTRQNRPLLTKRRRNSGSTSPHWDEHRLRRPVNGKRPGATAYYLPFFRRKCEVFFVWRRPFSPACVFCSRKVPSPLADSVSLGQ